MLIPDGWHSTRVWGGGGKKRKKSDTFIDSENVALGYLLVYK